MNDIVKSIFFLYSRSVCAVVPHKGENTANLYINYTKEAFFNEKKISAVLDLNTNVKREKLY